VITYEEIEENGWLHVEDICGMEYLLKDIEGNLDDGFTWKAFVEHGCYVFEVNLLEQACRLDLESISEQIAEYYLERHKEASTQRLIDDKSYESNSYI